MPGPSRPPLALLAGLAAVSAALAGCASTGATPAPFPRPAPPAASSPAAPGVPAAAPVPVATSGRDMGYVVTGTALALRGVPYRNGGHDPSGFDCSGFVSYVFGQNGIAVPRTVNDQYHAGREVDPQQGLQPGDLVFFTTVSPGAS